MTLIFQSLHLEQKFIARSFAKSPEQLSSFPKTAKSIFASFKIFTKAFVIFCSLIKTTRATYRKNFWIFPLSHNQKIFGPSYELLFTIVKNFYFYLFSIKSVNFPLYLVAFTRWLSIQ